MHTERSAYLDRDHPHTNVCSQHRDQRLKERERDLATIESEAYRKVQEMEGTADAKATEIYAKAYNQTPEAAQLFEFLKTMETYKQLITADTTMIFTTDSELFRFLKSSNPQAKPTAGIATPEFTPLNKLPTLLEVGRQ